MRTLSLPALACVVACASPPPAPTEAPAPAPEVPTADVAPPTDDAPAADPAPAPQASALTVTSDEFGEMKLEPIHCAISPAGRDVKIDGRHQKVHSWYLYLSNHPMDAEGASTSDASGPKYRLGINLYGPKGAKEAPMPPAGRFAPDPNEGEVGVPERFHERVELIAVTRSEGDEKPTDFSTGTGEGSVVLEAVEGRHITGSIQLKGNHYAASGAFDVDCVIRE